MTDSDLKRRTAKGLLWGGIGNGGMQLLSLLFGIFLSRILSPADYGVVGALLIFLAIGGMLAESGFTLALVNKRDISDEDFNSVFWFNVLASFVCYAVLFFTAPLIAHFYEAPEMTPLVRFLALGFVIGATASAPTAYLFRSLKVKERSRAQLGAMTASGVLGLVCAFIGLGYWALAIQNVAYIAANASLLWAQTPWRPSLRFNFRRIRPLLPFSLKQLAVTFFNNINNNFFPVLLGRFYGLWPTGCYTQGNKWTSMGANTIKSTVDSVGQPVLREASETSDRLERVFLKMLAFTAFISFPCMLGLGLVSEELIVITITNKWIEAVPIMQILCIWGSFIPLVTLYGNLFNSNNRPGVYMWNTILPGALQALALLITFRYSIHVMLIVYVCINVAWTGVWQWQARRLCGIHTRRVAASILPYMLTACGAMACAALVAEVAASLYVSLLVKAGVAALVYIAGIGAFNPTMIREAFHYLFRKQRRTDV